MREQDFALRSSYPDESPSIEALVRARLGEDAPILLNGIWVPTSSFTALYHSPHKRPATPHEAVTVVNVGSGESAASSPGESTPAATTPATSTSTVVKDELPPPPRGPLVFALPEPAGTPIVPLQPTHIRISHKSARKPAVRPRQSAPAPATGTLKVSLSRSSTSNNLLSSATAAVRTGLPPRALTGSSSPLTPIATAETRSLLGSPPPLVLAKQNGVETPALPKQEEPYSTTLIYEDDQLLGSFAAPPPPGGDILAGPRR